MPIQILAELFADPAEHTKSWWSRLFEGHGDIAFDDYEKDLSDLPAPVRAQHARMKAIDEERSRLESQDDLVRKALQDADVAR